MVSPPKVLKYTGKKFVWLVRIFPEGHKNIFDAAVKISVENYAKSTANDEGIVMQPEYHHAIPVSRAVAGQHIKW